jgi:hypothetical protein
MPDPRWLHQPASRVGALRRTCPSDLSRRARASPGRTRGDSSSVAGAVPSPGTWDNASARRPVTDHGAKRLPRRSCQRLFLAQGTRRRARALAFRLLPARSRPVPLTPRARESHTDGGRPHTFAPRCNACHRCSYAQPVPGGADRGRRQRVACVSPSSDRSRDPGVGLSREAGGG